MQKLSRTICFAGATQPKVAICKNLCQSKDIYIVPSTLEQMMLPKKYNGIKKQGPLKKTQRNMLH